MRRITADWVFPVSAPPVANGVVLVGDDGIILDVRRADEFEQSALEFYTGILCPGFINAHCHLELSYLKMKIPEHTGLPGFITDFLRIRNDEHPAVLSEIERADKEMQEQGIVGVGDISNTAITFLMKAASRIRYHTFVECFGIEPQKAQQFFAGARSVLHQAQQMALSASLSPHAPYSMSDELLEMVCSFRQNPSPVISYHNQESEEENRLFRGEPNLFDEFFASRNLPAVHRRGQSSLMAHTRFFPSDKKILFVHNTFSSPADFEFAVKSFNAWFCTCPNANLYIENRLPDYSFWKKYSDRVCIGTDSYASNHRLSMLEELKTIQAYDLTVSLAELIRWSTLNGAAFFGWENHLGSFDQGKKPGINLIERVDPDTLRLTADSIVRPLV